MFKKSALFSVVAFAFSFSALATGASAQEAKKRTVELVEVFKKVKTAPEGEKLSKADQATNQKVFDELDAYFDYETLTSEPIAPHKAKLSKAQQAKFKEVFRELIRRVSYPSSGEFLREAKIEYKSPKVKGKRVDVPMHSELEAEDFESDVIFHWENQNGQLKVVDVSFDGASLMKDYKNQFGRLIKKHGPEGFVTTLEKRLAKIREQQDA